MSGFCTYPKGAYGLRFACTATATVLDGLYPIGSWRWLAASQSGVSQSEEIRCRQDGQFGNALLHIRMPASMYAEAGNTKCRTRPERVGKTEGRWRHLIPLRSRTVAIPTVLLERLVVVVRTVLLRIPKACFLAGRRLSVHLGEKNLWNSGILPPESSGEGGS